MRRKNAHPSIVLLRDARQRRFPVKTTKCMAAVAVSAVRFGIGRSRYLRSPVRLMPVPVLFETVAATILTRDADTGSSRRAARPA